MGTKTTIKCPECGGWGEFCGTTLICGFNYEGVEVDVEAPCLACDGTGKVEVDADCACATCDIPNNDCARCSHGEAA